jgi:hypothetical protein
MSTNNYYNGIQIYIMSVQAKETIMAINSILDQSWRKKPTITGQGK